MLLALDVGNTNIVFGCMEDGKVVGKILRMRTERQETWAEYAVKMQDFISLLGLRKEQFDAAIIGSVVPPVTEALTQAIENVLGVKSMVVDGKMKTGLDLCLDDPSSVGADLIIGGAAVIHHYGTPAIVMDLGTATTVTVIDKDSRFCGGAIIPGVYLSYNALASGTALLPGISISAPEKAISTNTVDCMRSGAVYGTAAMIDGLIDRMEEELGYPCIYVATGGLAASIVKECRHEVVFDNNLLLKGLWLLYEMNR